MDVATIHPYGKVRRDIANALSIQALGVLTKITSNINLHTNELRASLASLADLFGCSIPTLTKYTSELERAGYIRVTRSGGGSHHDVNVYHLAGTHAETSLIHGKTFEATPKNNLGERVKNLNTDYIDSIESKSEEEDTNPDSAFKSKSDTGEYDLEREGEDPTLPGQDAALRKLEELGITGAALEAAHLYPERISAAFKIAETTKDVRSMPDFISRILMNGIYDKHVNQTDQNQPSTQIRQKEFTGSWSDYVDGVLPSDLSPEPPIQGTLDARHWQAALIQMECQLDTASFQTGLRDARYSRTDADGTFIIEVHSPYARDLLQHRLYRNVRRALSDAIGNQTELRFIVASEANTS